MAMAKRCAHGRDRRYKRKVVCKKPAMKKMSLRKARGLAKVLAAKGRPFPGTGMFDRSIKASRKKGGPCGTLFHLERKTAKFAKTPAQKAALNEGIRYYRKWCDESID